MSFARWVLSGDVLLTERSGKADERRGPGVLRKILLPEKLRMLPDEPDRAARGAPRFWHLVFRGEELPQTDAADGRTTSGPAFLHWLLAAEACRREAAPALQRRTGFLRWLLAAEACRRETAPALQRRTGFLRWLLAAEPCPREAAPALQRRAGFLRWLLSREKL